jgi:drug/metabolite transporter (DMT)-like permease
MPKVFSAGKSLAAEAALASNTIVWGATFVVVKSAIRDVSPILFLFLRFSLATISLLLFFAFRRRRALHALSSSHHSITAAGCILPGLFLFSGYLLQTWGLQSTTAPRSAFLTGLTSVAVPFLAALVYRIRPQPSEVVGVLVATAGLGLMTLHQASSGSGFTSAGDLLTLLCAFGFAAYIVTLGHFTGQMSFEVLSITQVGVATGLSGLLFWWAEKPRIEWNPKVVCAILVTGILATAVAFTVQAWAQQYTSSTRTALIYMLEPVVAWITSYCVMGEGLSGRAAAGAALILGGVAMVELKPLRPRRHPLN